MREGCSDKPEYSMEKFDIALHKSLGKTFPAFSKRFEKIIKHNGLKSLRVFAGEPNFWESVKASDFFIFRFSLHRSEKQMVESILPIIENELGKKVFPNYKTRWHHDDKGSQYYLCKAHGFPMVETWVFWDMKDAMNWIQSAPLPLVFKLKSGAGSKNVALVKSRSLARKLIKQMFSVNGMSSFCLPGKADVTFINKYAALRAIRGQIAYRRGRINKSMLNPYWQPNKDYVLFQRFLPGNKFDVRVNVIGERAFVFKRYVRPNDFRASGSGLVDYDISDVNPECIRIGFEISRTLCFQSMAYDFIFDRQSKPWIAEMCYTFLDHPVYKCPGYFDPDMNWHKGHYWPQFCQLQDLLENYDLEQPNEETML